MSAHAARDPFEPRNEPARSIYLALAAETAKRKARTVAEWVAAERAAVHEEAGRQAAATGQRAPTMKEVENAERRAMGSVDYAAKWAYGVAEAMRHSAPALA